MNFRNSRQKIKCLQIQSDRILQVQSALQERAYKYLCKNIHTKFRRNVDIRNIKKMGNLILYFCQDAFSPNKLENFCFFALEDFGSAGLIPKGVSFPCCLTNKLCIFR